MACTRGASAARQASGSAADAGSVIRSQAWSGSSSAIAFSSTMRSVVRRPASAASTASQRSSWRGKRRSRRWRSSRAAWRSASEGTRASAAAGAGASARRRDSRQCAGSRPRSPAARSATSMSFCASSAQRLPSPQRSGSIVRWMSSLQRGHALGRGGAGRLPQAQVPCGPRTGRERGPARRGRRVRLPPGWGRAARGRARAARRGRRVRPLPAWRRTSLRSSPRGGPRPPSPRRAAGGCAAGSEAAASPAGVPPPRLLHVTQALRSAPDPEARAAPPPRRAARSQRVHP